MKRFFIMCITLFIFFFLSITVYAHPGRTDANGGHYDRSTGQYHYHTGEYAGKRGGGTPSETLPPVVTISASSPTGSESIQINQDNSEVANMPTWGYTVLLMLSFLFLLLYVKLVSTKRELSWEQEHHSTEMAEIAKSLNEFHKMMEDQYGKDYIYELTGAPYGYKLNKTMDEIYSDAGDSCAFFYASSYFTSTKSKFHKKNCRYAPEYSPKNIYFLHKNRIEPCKICNPYFPSMEWADAAVRYIKFYKKYAKEAGISKAFISREEIELNHTLFPVGHPGRMPDI